MPDAAVHSRMKGCGEFHSLQGLHSGFNTRTAGDILVTVSERPRRKTTGEQADGNICGACYRVCALCEAVQHNSYDENTHLTAFCLSGRRTVIMWLFYSNSSGL